MQEPVISILCAEDSHQGMRRDFQTHPCKGNTPIVGIYTEQKDGTLAYAAIPRSEQRPCQCECHEKAAKRERGVQA